MRRIHIAMLALGLVGVLGVTLAQTAAQPAPAGGVKAPVSGPAIPVIPAASGAIPDIVLPPADRGPEINLPPTLPDVVMPPLAAPPLPPAKPQAADVKLTGPMTETKPVSGPPPVIKAGTPEQAKPAFADPAPIAAPA